MIAMKRKRSQNINLGCMLKHTVVSASTIAAVFSLSGCGGGDEGYLYSSVEDCIEAHPGQDEICQSAYDEAQVAALESGPRYASESLCEMEFGDDQCEPLGETRFWVPFVAGYVVSEVIDEVGDYFEYKRKRKYHGYGAAPAFLSSKGGKSFYYGLDERKLGKVGQRKISLTDSSFQKQKAKMYTNKTVRRGGFGSTVRSSSSSSSRSWGG